MADRHADRAGEASGTAEMHAGRAWEATNAAEAHADRAGEASTSAEEGAVRATEAAGGADRHAGRADEVARRIAEAAEAAEHRAALAQEAAAAAAEAAKQALDAAEQANSEVEAVRRAAQETSGGRGFEAAPLLAPFRGHGAEPAAEAAPANGHAPKPADGPDPHRPLFGRAREAGPAREKRPGFDDATEPMATIELNGHFRELNQAFSDLVGYSEADFKSASWPPVVDRANLSKHRDQMRQLVDGEIEAAEVSTGYVHAQGLMVPMNGTITLVKAVNEPDHFLLAVKA